MKQLLQQIGTVIAAGLAAACCLGATWALAGLSAIGAGFLRKDAVLIPLFTALVVLSVALVYRSTRKHGVRAPLGAAAAGAITAIVGASLWSRALGPRSR
jgi:hypothetical protein